MKDKETTALWVRLVSILIGGFIASVIGLSIASFMFWVVRHFWHISNVWWFVFAGLALADTWRKLGTKVYREITDKLTK